MSSRFSRLLRPQSIAYIGGSQIAGPIKASRRAGYDGNIWVVNPIKSEIEGISCHPSIDDLPTPPDAAVVGLSPERAITAVAELSRAGAGGAVVMSSGFSELGTDEGRDRQERLRLAAGDMPLLGPNCLGLINQYSGAAVWGDDNLIERQDGPTAALISQSGALLIGMTNVEQAFPLGYAASVGNQAVTSVADLVSGVLEDERVRAIGLYLEGMDDGEALGAVCLSALKRGVPVIALKGGDDGDGAKVSLSHTASMVVERNIWEAFCHRFGIHEVTSPKALVETLKLLTVSGMPAGNRLSILSYSGGLNGLAATRCTALGLALPMPTQENLTFMRELLPETVALNNPLDLNIPYSASDGSISMRDTKGMAEAITAFAEGVSDQIVFFIDVPRPGSAGLEKIWQDSLDALLTARQNLKIPISVAGILPEGLPLEFRNYMQRNGIAALLGYSEAMEAIAASVKLAATRARLLRLTDPESLYPRRDCSQTSMLNEAIAKDALKRHGLKTPRSEVVTLADVAMAAQQLQFPLAVKVLSETIAHKAKLGGVVLGLNSPESVESACNQIARNVESSADGHTVEQFLIEEMILDADVEIILGVKRHPATGLALMMGIGGSRAEETAKFTTMLLPLQEKSIEAALECLRLTDHPAVGDLTRAAEAVASYADAHKETLVTLDVNPVMLTTGGEAIAVDALIVLGQTN